MDITDMILVTENYKGTETNYLMGITDYLDFIDKDSYLSRNELAEDMCELGRTLGNRKEWSEIYFAANKTISARYCADGNQLTEFLQGKYNPEEWHFDEQGSSRECIDYLKVLGISTKGWAGGAAMHYERLESRFEPGQVLHNFNNNDYRVMECLTDKNLLVMDLNTGNYAVAVGTAMYRRSPKGMEGSAGIVGVEWDHGVYLSNVPSEIDFRNIRREYGTPLPETAALRGDGRFDVEIKEVLSRVEPIEAETLGEAIDKAMEMYYGQDIILDAEDMKGVDFLPYAGKTAENKTR